MEINPKKNGKITDEFRDPVTKRFIKGNPGGGRPLGSISIKDQIKRYYKEHPEEFEDLCKFYREDKDMKKLLWNYIDGLPQQNIDMKGEVNFNVKLTDGNNTTPKAEPTNEGQS